MRRRVVRGRMVMWHLFVRVLLCVLVEEWVDLPHRGVYGTGAYHEFGIELCRCDTIAE